MHRLCLFFGLCLISSFVIAQSTDATVSGGVSDAQGNLIVNAEVQIANDATGVVYSAKTNNAGMYLVPILPPGQYHVQVSKSGFKTIIRADVVLNVQSALSLNFMLPVGATSESVTVDTNSPSLNTTDASVSTVVDQKFVANMPLNGRSFQDLISMTPGVVTQSPQTTGQVVGGSGDFSVNGQRANSNYYTVDGVSANFSAGNAGGVAEPATGGAVGGSTALGTTQTLISVDALQEFRVQSSTYSAEFGRSPGGQFSLATRSGANLPHGNLYDYLRNNFFDANDWFNDHYGKPIPALRQNDFGGTFGGPVWLPRLYNGKDHTFFFVSYEGLRLTQPTAATVQYVPDAAMRQQAVSAMQPILNAFPLPNGPDFGSTNSPSLAEFIAPYSLPSTINSTSIRLDQTIGQHASMFFRFGDTPSLTVRRSNFARTTTTSNALTDTFGMNAQLATNLTNEFRVGYASSQATQLGVLDSFGGALPIDLSSALGAGSFSGVLPNVYIYLPNVGTSSLSPYYGKNFSKQWNIVDLVTLSHGSHSLKFGVDYRHIESTVNPPSVQVYPIFETVPSILTGAPTVPYIFNYDSAVPVLDQTALFVQDEWHVRSHLSLSLGLRWEIDPPPTEAHGHDAYTLLGSLAVPATLAVAPEGTPLYHTTWYNFAPRLGMAWTAHSTPGYETVVRTGGGVFFDSPDEIATLGFSQLGFNAYAVEAGAKIPFTTSQLTLPIHVAPPYTSSVVVAFPNHLQLPYTLQWNVAVQQALGKSQSVTFSYVASNGRRLIGLQEKSLSKINPNFGVVEYFAGGDTSNYQSLQVQYQRSIAKGLQALGAFTWSHAIDFGSNSTAQTLQRGNADFDVRNNAQAGLTWDLPSLSGPRVVTSLVNGWGLDGRLNLRTAFPITLGGTVAVDPATGNEYAGGLNMVPNQPIYLRGSQYPGGKAINKAAFAIPATGTIGDAPRNFVRGFEEGQLNLAARREFTLRDWLKLQFRAETFNLLNHPNFGYVDSTFTDPLFGQATQMLNSSLGTVASQYQQGGARSMQFALKLQF